jgi:hypothetical protein
LHAPPLAFVAIASHRLSVFAHASRFSLSETESAGLRLFLCDFDVERISSIYILHFLPPGGISSTVTRRLLLSREYNPNNKSQGLVCFHRSGTPASS